jgi:hypothetical protein
MFDRHAWSRAVRLLSWLVVVAAIFWSRPASAYPWMIRHEYQGCVPCHADPSGAGLLTEYGRAMGENVLRTRYGSKPPDEPPVYARFLFGVPTPDWLLLGGSVRNGVQWAGPLAGPLAARFLEMEADLKAQITVGRFRAYGSLGYMSQGANYAQVTSITSDPNCSPTGPVLCKGNVVSREHWVGVDLGEDKQFLLRAGRLDIPFGIRSDEHDLFVRNTATTRTNINESQQHGVALSYTGQIVRGELMAILGNYQVNPDAFRERGYAGFVELSLAPWAAAGVSSLVTYAAVDVVYGTPHTIRQVHGLFTRLAVPKTPLVVLAEADALITTSDVTTSGSGGTSPGMVGMLQADVEPTQGVHLMATGETWVQGASTGTAKSFSSYLTALWFFAPHADLRFDFVTQSLAGSVSIYALPQLHLYL